MGKLADLVVRIAGDHTGLSKSLTQAQKKMKKFGDDMKKLGSNLTKFVTLPILGIATASIAAFAKQEKAEAKLNAIIKSTGQAAGFTTKEMLKMAAALQEVTTFGDEVIIESQAILATFTKIGEDVFPKATETILNMSAALGQDLKSSAIQLGKALNDPVMGVTALRRVGVQLEKEQEDLIKQFVEMGDIVSAQNIILGELEVQMGGVARAMGDTASGSLLQLQNSMSDLMEDVGELVLKGLKPLIDGAKDMIKGWQNLDKSTKKMIVTIAGVAAALGPMILLLTKLPAIFDTITKHPIIFAIAAITTTIVAMSVAMNELAANAKDVKNAFDVASGATKGTVTSVSDMKEAQATLREEVDRLQESYLKVKDAFPELARNISKEQEKLIEQVNSLTLSIKETEQAEKDLADASTKAEKKRLKRIKKQQEAEEKRKKLAAEALKEAERLKIVEKERLERAEKEAEILAANLDKISKINMTQIQMEKEKWKIIDEEREKASQIEKERLEQELQDFQDTYSEISNIIGDVMSKIGSITGQFFANENTRLDNKQKKERKNIEKNIKDEEERKKALEQSDKEFDRKRASLKRKQFIVDKAAAIITSIIDTATAVVKVIPNPFLMALSAGLGALQTGLIASQPMPQFQAGVSDFTVPPGFERDNFVMGVSSGENVNVTPAGESGQMQHITINIGSKLLYDDISEATRNRKILVDERSLVKG